MRKNDQASHVTLKQQIKGMNIPGAGLSQGNLFLVNPNESGTDSSRASWSNYLPMNEPITVSELTSQFLGMGAIVEKRPRSEMMGNIRVPGFLLQREITIKVFCRNEEYFAEFSDLNLIGRGDSEEEARRDLGELIVSVYDDLVDEPDENLSSPLLADKQFVSTLVRKTA